MTIVIAVLSLTIASCKKDTVQVPTSYTMVVANAAMGVQAQTSFTNSGTVNYNARGIYYAQTGQQVTVANATAPTTYIFNQSPAYSNGLYSLFIAGDSTTTEAILIDDNNRPFIPNDIIYKCTDSVVNVRFINLSPNSVPVKVKINGAAANLVDNLPYKGISTWMTFNAIASSTNYSLQIRDAATDALIASYTFTANATKRFKNVTLMIRGKQGTNSGTFAFGITEVNYF
jgi:hypothetical protein